MSDQETKQDKPRHERDPVIYRLTMPPRAPGPIDYSDDSPLEYVVTRWGPGRAQIMFHGRYPGDRWEVNVPARGLVEHLLAEIERLTAIVEKLPKTADGVPIVPGVDPVWSRTLVKCVAESAGPPDDALVITHVGVGNCYSTPELASAASATPASEGDGAKGEGDA